MKDVWILGINGLGNSPSACLIKDGEIVAMAEEERFTRVKVSYGVFPIESISYCLAEGEVSIDDLSEISFAWDCNYYLYKMPWFLIVHFLKTFKLNFKKGGSSNLKRAIRELYWYNPYRVKRLIKKELEKRFEFVGKLKIKFVNHHLAHAFSAYYASGLPEASIIVIDGSGESVATSIWNAQGTQVSLQRKWSIPNSLGWFYSMATEYIGYTANRHEGKLMALAAYGVENKVLEGKFSKIISCDKDSYKFDSTYSISGSRKQDAFYSDELIELLGKARQKKESINAYHQSIAFYTQNLLEKIVLHLVKQVAKTPSFNGNLCIVGGVGLNCKMNGAVSSLSEVKNTYVPPFPNDAGTAYGAALEGHFRYSDTRPPSVAHAYWGPSYHNNQIEAALIEKGLSYEKIENIEEKAAQLLFGNKIIGWFQGRMEIGARALGNRSILANPTIVENRNFINREIKKREVWRPFAASILYEKRKEFFDLDQDAPFMALAFSVKEKSKAQIPAAIHIDGTTRPQFVSQRSNEKYWKLIQHFGNLSGTYAVLNTSFNLKEEPIVCTPEQAIIVFLNSPLDALIIGDFLIQK